MPRPAGNSYFVLLVLLILPFTGLTTRTTAASQTPPTGGVPSHESFGGIWVLNRDLGDAPGMNTPAGSDDGGRRGGGGGGGRGGRGGRGGGRGGGGYGQRGGGGMEENMERRRAIADYVRVVTQDSKQLTIVVHDAGVNITDIDGGVLNIQTDDKKVDERVENGLVKVSRKSRWDGGALVSEIQVDNGPKIVRNYSLSPGGTQLRVATSVEGGGTRAMNISHVYERPLEQQ